jgi:hypothetical protein
VDPERLLYDLCVQLGFCLDPDDRRELVASPPSTVDAFTDEVIRREGMDPVLCDSALRKQVRIMVSEHMGEPLGRRRKSRRRR